MSSPTRLLRSRRATPLPNHYQVPNPKRDKSSTEDTPISPTPSCCSSASSCLLLSKDSVTDYLRFHKEFLEEFILQDVPQETLERLLIKKAQRLAKETDIPSSLSKWKFCVHSDKQELIQLLTDSIHSGAKYDSVLYQLSDTIAQAVNASAFGLYLIDASQPTVLVPFDDNEKSYAICEGDTIAGYVAATQETLNINILEERNIEKFPKGIILQEPAASSVMCVPVLEEGGRLVGVLEMVRKASEPQFGAEDEEIVQSYLAWAAVAVHCAHSHGNCEQQRMLNEVFLSLTKLMLADTPDTDAMLQMIQSVSTELVNADRTALFLVDDKKEELYAYVFSVGPNESNYVKRVVDNEPSSVEDFITQLGTTLREVVSYRGKLVSMPIQKGVAGHCASTGQMQNITSARSNERFTSEMDAMTGYTTQTLLCAPLVVRGKVIGVLEAVNKRDNGTFTVEDERIFQAFALFCGLIIHSSRVHKEMSKAEQKIKVLTEVAAYHRQCQESEFQRVKSLPFPKENQFPLSSFGLNTSVISADTKAQLVVTMLGNLVDISQFDSDCLLKFSMTVQKNYRPFPYHNWDHAFSVAQYMYAVIMGSPACFTATERMSLFIACLCHDLDHRGRNNAFLINTGAPLAALYSSSSILEKHHFSQTIALLQIEGLNIFSHLTEDQYKTVLTIMQKAILATDLANFFGNKAALQKIVSSGQFNWQTAQHRELVHCLMMTICDLCCTAKPWEAHKKNVEDLFIEFHEQGDEEKARGLQPLRMMDRNYHHELPSCQVGFLKSITIPCCELLVTALPHAQDLLQNAQNNLTKWESLQRSD